MKQEQLQVFIQGVIEYFNKIAGSQIDVGVPYLKEQGKKVILGYTGVIGISGRMQGGIYITADRNFLMDLLNKIMPGANSDENKLTDMIGELANTIAGNAQKTLGKEFNISIPMVLTQSSKDQVHSFEIKAPTFVIPFKWSENQAYLVVGLVD